jgi:PLP dependent protein
VIEAETLSLAIAGVRSRMAAACRRSGRLPEEVTLVAVTKTVPLNVVRLAHQAGLTDFGENYARELETKAAALPDARWHFLGKLQRGNARSIARHADVIHSAEPSDGCERVAARAHRDGGTIPCLIQVDFTGRRQGVAPEAIPVAAERLATLPGIDVVGLMTLPPWTGRSEATRPFFARLRDLRNGLRDRWPGVRELSMGMSGDYEVAIEEGATMVRVGTALFGERHAGEAR